MYSRYKKICQHLLRYAVEENQALHFRVISKIQQVKHKNLCEFD